MSNTPNPPHIPMDLDGFKPRPPKGMKFNPHFPDFHGEWWSDRCAPECDDQLPAFSKIGRGLQGDGYKVTIAHDGPAETYLEGWIYDSASGTWSSDWLSDNINGGIMMYQYNLRPWTNPQTFTITFRYVKPKADGSERPDVEWIWTTPAIPYIWDADDDGLADVDEIVGTGVADLFIKKTTEDEWNYPTINHEDWPEHPTSEEHGKLIYPDSWTREMFNAPNPGDPWSVNLQYGIGGDIDAPNVDDLAKIIGISVENLYDLVINDDDTAFFGYPNLMSLIQAILGDIIGKIVGQSPTNVTYDITNNEFSITWTTPLDGITDKIAGGNINLYSGNNENLATAFGIFTHTGDSADNDIKAV